MSKVALLILDGWGRGKNYPGNAIELANRHYVENLSKAFPIAYLQTSGEAVGLPDGQMGNSEVGHLNIGAGRVVYQQLGLIHNAFKDEEVEKNVILLDALQYAKTNKKAVHFIGLLSDGGVHSHNDHLHGLCTIAEQHNQPVFIHAFLDGRDTDPKSGKGYLETLLKHIEGSTAKLASVVGRYYAMDRDKRWERVKLAYDLLVKGEGESSQDIVKTIEEKYTAGITDEFMKPIILVDEVGNPNAIIQEGDVVININFRTDRGREITQVLTQHNFPEQDMKKINLHYITMTVYDETFENVQTLFHNDDLAMTLGEVLELAGKTQVRIAETEKYPHVTFFFSGGRETEFIGEHRYMCPSPKVATYDLQPEMSAEEVKNSTLKAITEDRADFIVTNFANPDMVGHTGVLTAVIKAIEKVDACVEEIIKIALANNYTLLITADHGNSEYMLNEDGTPNTAHTTNEVPLWLVSNTQMTLHNGKLADLAPTILHLLGVTKPVEMTGVSLV
ncbi:MAG: 2,3-bisphosphoglycerate-independent phosphoglycerate mutase [Flavobacteriaceae bacterium]|nr:2,3-bisphosphoglycerate-independent phosphoglycerate mutase [Flavobacteriaceae bacterium]